MLKNQTLKNNETETNPVNYTTTAIITAGGISSRMKGTDKLFALISGIPVIVHVMLAFQEAESISSIIISCRDENKTIINDLAYKYKITKLSAIASSGENRAESVLNGIAAALTDDKKVPDYIAIHDGARPFISVNKINETVKKAFETGAAILVVPVKDTVKKANGGIITRTIDRNTLYFAQTPQVFNLKLYRRAVNNITVSYFNENEMIKITDDSMMFEASGFPVSIVEGDYKNIKITTQEDLEMVNAFIDKEKNENDAPPFRIGQGYDVHCFCENRKLVLLGAVIPHELGLLGHSDADVAAHAVMDSLLGALALGDIGKHFPDTSPLYKDADSMKMLSEVAELVTKNNYKICNIDVTIIAETPKLSPYISLMRENLSAACKTTTDKVSVKATTEEGLGLAGKGIGANAVCCLQSGI